MRIALWDIDPFADSKSRFSEIGWNVVLASPAHCGDELLNGNVDVALVPCVEVLRDTAAFSVLPGIGFASERGFPHVALRLNRALNEIRTVRTSEDSAPFFGVASILLREQYEAITRPLRDGAGDADLLFGHEAGAVPNEQRLDLGLEWFELTGTPLSWGFFVARPGTQPDASTTSVQELLAAVLRGDADLVEPQSVEEIESSASGLRVSYDPDVAEGIDELVHYLFYVGVLDDIPALRLMATPE